MEESLWYRKYIAIYLATFTLAIGPFFNGMFYEPMRLAGIALTCIAYTLSHSDPRVPRGFQWGPVDWAIVAWFGSYLLATITMVYPRGHLSAMLDFAAVMGMYFMVRRQPGSDRFVRWTLVAFGLLMVAMSLSSFAGITWFDRYFNDLHVFGRLSGGFQYPNTFAAWLFVLIMLLLPEIRDPVTGPWARAISGLFATVFMMTLSRAGLLATLPAFALVAVAARPADRWYVLPFKLLVWVPATILGTLALNQSESGDLLSTTILILASAIPPLLAPWSERFAERFSAVLTRRQLVMGFGLAVVLVVTAFGVYLSRMSRADIPRIFHFSLQERNVALRFTYNRDAWSLMADHHFLGSGGRAWSKLYTGKQSYYYATSEVHNHFLQTGVESGLLGLGAFTAIWLLALWQGWRVLRRHTSDLTTLGLMSAIAFLGVHSFMDFNLSYISLLLLMALLLAHLSNRYRNVEHAVQRGRAWGNGLAGFCALATAISLVLGMAHWKVNAGDKLGQAGDLAGAIQQYKVAAKLDPLSPTPLAKLGALANYVDASEYGLDGRAIWSRIQAIDRYSLTAPLHLAHFANREGRWDEAISLANSALKLAPMDKHYNAAIANLLWYATLGPLEKGDLDQAKRNAEQLASFIAGLQQRIAQTAPYRGLWDNPIDFTPVTHLRAGQALLVAGRPAEAVSHLTAAMESPSTKGEATGWLYLSYLKQGNAVQAQTVRDKDPDSVESFITTSLYNLLFPWNS